jgi:predicted regulator of Ras-like GTPase activity (Roadblock/LC7/MglB family)
MDADMLALLEFDGVLTALATTSDGLVVAGAGLTGDDAEIVGASGSSIASRLDANSESSAHIRVGSAGLHVLAGTELSLVVLTEPYVAHSDLVPEMESRLESVSLAFS